MANNYTSLKLSYNNAFTIKNRFIDADQNHVFYVFMGNSQEQDNEFVVPDITCSTATEKQVWDNMFAAKLITSYNVEMVIPRKNWAANTKYKQFDDIVSVCDLIEANTETGHEPMYVITDDYNVYKCISNNSDSYSTDKPVEDYNSESGYNITSDGYVWKYMYNIKEYNKYLTNDWIPVPTSINDLEYNSSTLNILDGAVASVIMVNSGTGYINSDIEVFSNFDVGCTILSVSSTDNVSTNMGITGHGLSSETYITNVDTIYNRLTLSSQTIAKSNIGNILSIFTRVNVVGDGTGAKANAVLANGTVEKIDVTSIGSNYSFANAYIYGSGTGANTRVILGPKYGHGYNPAKELGVSHIMVYTAIGRPDSTEDGLLSIDTSFRQYGLLGNPHKYNESTSIALANANTVISQTTDMTMVAGSLYQLNEVVYQGVSQNNATYIGIVHAQDANIVRLVNTKGTPTIGALLKGSESLVNRSLISHQSPEFEPYSGDIIYVQNVQKVDRSIGQSEILKFVIKV